MKKYLVATVFSLISMAAIAGESGVFVGLGVGQSNIKLNSTDFNYLNTKDESDTAFKIYGGYQFNKYLAVEGSYIDFGKATGSAINIKEKYKVTSYTLAAVGSLPLGSSGVSLLGKLGVSRNHVKDDYTFKTQSFRHTKTKTDVLWGVGAKYMVTNNVGIRLEYENLGNAGEPISNADTGTGRSKLALISAGVEWKF